MSRELIIERSPFGLRAGLLEDGRLLEVDQLDESVPVPQGDIVLGRVRMVDRDLGAAFVDCGYAADAFLGVRDARHLAGAGRDATIDRLVSEGQGILVQVRQGPAAGKAARVTGDIALVGLYLVYRPGRRGIALSARLERTPAAAEQRTRAQALFAGAGVTVRSAAPAATDAELLAELARLRERWARIETAAAAAIPPARLHGVDDPLHRLLGERLAPDLERVVVGDRASLARARNWLAEWQPGMVDRLASVPDPFEATGAAEQLEQALQPTVPLPGGGSLIIEPTAALTAIDVNGGGRQALEANLAAAREIGQQLRLRRIGGTIVVDFIDLPARTARARVLAALREAVAGDPAPVQVFPMSRFGLVEMSRKRTGPSLAEMLGRRCPACEGGGTLPALRWRAEQLTSELRKLPPGKAEVLAAPDLHDYLTGAGRGAWETVARRAGISLKRDPSSVPGSYRIEEVS